MKRSLKYMITTGPRTKNVEGNNRGMYTLLNRDLFVFCTARIYNIMQWEAFRILSYSSLLWIYAPQDQISFGKERQVFTL